MGADSQELRRRSKEEVEDAISTIRRIYDRGRSSLRKHDRMDPGEIVKEANKLGVHRETLRQARVFAVRYTPKELDALCDLALRNGWLLGPRKIYSLVTILQKDQRKAFQRKAAKGNWSDRRLHAELKKRRGRSHFGGRKPRAPADRGDVYVQVIDICSRWRRLYEVIAKAPQGDDGKSWLEVLPTKLRKQIKRANGVLRKLEGSADPRAKAAMDRAKKAD